MEKVRRNNFFPPLVIPDAYKRRKVNLDFSKEGEKVKTELEQRTIFHDMFRKTISNELDCDRGTRPERNADVFADEFCVACAQRVSLQTLKRPTVKRGVRVPGKQKEGLKGCICILCKRPLPLSPQGVGNHHIIVDGKITVGDANEGHRAKIGRKDYIKSCAIEREFQISSLHYDSRLEAPNYKVETEQYLPPKEVMKRSERKCQMWLLKNEEHLKMVAARHRP